MAITSVSTATYLSDTVNLIRNDLNTNITDPISSTRQTSSKFVMTSYPQRPVEYPIITIKDISSSGLQRMGIGSELYYVQMVLEIRVWARNVKERDELAQEIINYLRSNQLSGSSPTITANLHDSLLLSTVNVDELGEQGIKSKVIEWQFRFALGA